MNKLYIAILIVLVIGYLPADDKNYKYGVVHNASKFKIRIKLTIKGKSKRKTYELLSNMKMVMPAGTIKVKVYPAEFTLGSKQGLKVKITQGYWEKEIKGFLDHGKFKSPTGYWPIKSKLILDPGLSYTPGTIQFDDMKAVLTNKNSNVRRSAVKALERLGKLGDKKAVKSLIAALKNQNSDVQCFAGEALGELGDKRAVKPLIAALKDHHKSVRGTAVDALGKLGDKRAVKPLIAALKDHHKSVRSSAVFVLGGLGDKRAVKPLIAMLKDKDSYVRGHAVYALGGLGDQRAVKPLISALKDHRRFVRSYAARALGGLGDKRAVEPLIAALKDQDRYVRISAVISLWGLGDKRAVEPLIAALKDQDSDVRNYAVNALGRLGDKRAIEPIEALLKKEPNPFIQKFIKKILEKIRQNEKSHPPKKKESQPLTYGRLILNDRPLGYWRLDEERGPIAHDTILRLNGVYKNGVLLGTKGLLTRGWDKAAFFDGEDDFVEIAPKITTLLSLLPKRKFSVEAWAKYKGFSAWGSFIGTFEDNNNYEKGLLLGNVGSDLCFALSTTGADDGNGSLTYLSCSGKAGIWYHIVGTYDGATMKLYVNGRLKNSSQQQKGNILYDQNASFNIGVYKDKNEFFSHHGLLAEVALYNYVLSASQIEAHYEVGYFQFP